MKFDDRFMEEIKGRLRLSDVIGRTVKLRRQGREFVGLSPFNREKSPSFFVNDEKGFFHDFSSGKHGDLVDWLRETGGLSFREAVETLAAEAGVPLPVEDPREREREKARAGLQDWLEEAAKWFERQLRRPDGAHAREYLEKRGLPEAEWTRFGLGFAPAERTALRDAMVQKGARPAELVEAGLLIAPEGGGQPYDRFRDRIIFPITDPRGRVVSFGGRALNPDDRAKYLNGPESPLFHKGATLYGLQAARKALAQRTPPGEPDPPLVVVEGYMDAIACQRAGIAAVAPLGTALTEDQMALLWRSHPEPTLCFDGDDAGRRAAWKSLDRALPLLQPGRSLQFVLLTGAKDPDELLREAGPGALKAAVADAKPFVEVLFDRERAAAEPLDTPERRTGLKATLRKLAGGIADKDLSAAYRDDLLGRFEALWKLSRPATTVSDAARGMAERRWSGRRRADLPRAASEEGRQAAARLERSMRPLTAAVAQAIVLHPELIDDHLEVFATQGFRDDSLQPLASALVNLRLAGVDTGGEDARRRLAAAGLEELLRKIADAAARSGAPFLDPDLPAEKARALWSQAFDVLVRLDALERAVEAAKADLERDADASAFLRLKAERDTLQRAAASGEVFDPPPA